MELSSNAKMRSVKVAILFMVVIVFPAIFYPLLQGKHSALYFIQINSIDKIERSAMFWFFISEIKVFKYGQLLKNLAKWFCVSFAILNFYAFLPVPYCGKQYTEPVFIFFYSVWTLVAIGSSIYFYICYKKNLA